MNMPEPSARTPDIIATPFKLTPWNELPRRSAAEKAALTAFDEVTPEEEQALAELAAHLETDWKPAEPLSDADRASFAAQLEAARAEPVKAPEAANDNAGAKPEPKRRIHVKTFQLRGTAAIPRREYLYEERLIRKYVSVDFAAGGVGKTSLKVTEALAMVTGRPLLGIKPPAPLRVWFVNAEDDIMETERKFEATAKHFGITAEEIGDRLLISDGRESDFIVLREERRGTAIVEPVIEEIAMHGAAHRVDVMMVDPFISTHAVNENDNPAVQRAANVWVKIADHLDCAVDLAHHVAKGDGEVNADSGRGASALKDKARAVRVLNRMTAAEAEKWGVPATERTDYFRADLGKANLTKAGGHSKWFHFASVAMCNGEGIGKPQDFTGVVEAWRPPSADDVAAMSQDREAKRRAELIADVPPDKLEGIKVLLQNRNCKTHVQADSWAGKVVAEILKLDPVRDRDHIKAMLQAWIDAEELVLVDIPDAHRHKKPHIKPAAAPWI